MAIKRVWIEEGCISCNLCEELCPEIFEVPPGEFCIVRPGAALQLIGATALEPKIQEAADSCPVEVIKLEAQ